MAAESADDDVLQQNAALFGKFITFWAGDGTDAQPPRGRDVSDFWSGHLGDGLSSGEDTSGAQRACYRVEA